MASALGTSTLLLLQPPALAAADSIGALAETVAKLVSQTESGQSASAGGTTIQRQGDQLNGTTQIPGLKVGQQATSGDVMVTVQAIGPNGQVTFSGQIVGTGGRSGGGGGSRVFPSSSFPQQGPERPGGAGPRFRDRGSNSDGTGDGNGETGQAGSSNDNRKPLLAQARSDDAPGHKATPVPTPALLPGLVGLGLGILRRQKRQNPPESTE